MTTTAAAAADADADDDDDAVLYSYRCRPERRVIGRQQPAEQCRRTSPPCSETTTTATSDSVPAFITHRHL